MHAEPPTTSPAPVARFDLPATLAQLQNLPGLTRRGLVDAKPPVDSRATSTRPPSDSRPATARRTDRSLQAFVGQVRDKLGAGVTQPAGAQLIGEAQRLLAA